MRRSFWSLTIFGLCALLCAGVIVANKAAEPVQSQDELVQSLRTPSLGGDKAEDRALLQLDRVERLIEAGADRKAKQILDALTAERVSHGAIAGDRMDKLSQRLQELAAGLPIEYTPLAATQTELGPDEFEIDNDFVSATRIGFRNNGVGQGNQRGRDNSQIQRHTMFPDATNNFDDVDVVKFSLNRPSTVRIETFDTEDPSNVDTIVALTDDTAQVFALNDDKEPGNLASRLELCLDEGEWFVTTVGFFIGQEFEYDIAVDVERPCAYEVEPNGACDQATPLDLFETIAGTHTPGVFSGDQDWYSFTLTEPGFVSIATDSVVSPDTTLELWSGCPGELIDSDDDGGPGRLSLIETALEPGTYYINVQQFIAFFSPPELFPYTLSVALIEPPLLETEPNDDCSMANPASLDTTVEAEINDPLDFDYFLLDVPMDQVATITTFDLDTVLQVSSADGSIEFACDDDSGPTLFSSEISCCFAAGSYCVGVKHFSGFATGDYTIEFQSGIECTPEDPPFCTADPGGFGGCEPFDDRP